MLWLLMSLSWLPWHHSARHQAGGTQSLTTNQNVIRLYIGCSNPKKDRKEGSYKKDGGSLLYICWFPYILASRRVPTLSMAHIRGALTRSPDWVLEYQLPAGLCLARGWGNGVFPIVPMVDVLGSPWMVDPPCHWTSCANWWTGGISWCRSLRKHRFIKLWTTQGF